MKNSGKKLNKKYIISLIAVLCLYVVCQKFGIISPGNEQTAGSTVNMESVQEEQTEDAATIQEEQVEETASVQEETSAKEESVTDPSESAPQEIVVTEYEFRNKKLQDSHYEKHGIEMGFATVEDYVEAANMVIANPEALHKLEEEDNDHVYFIEETCEFVILSQDGYIRTYYIADGGLDYFNRQ